jgi:uncharacterized protein (DUF849 family)
MDKAVVTCALTGVLTDPRQHPVPVTPEQMAREAKRAYDAGAAVVHVHFRRQEEGRGHLPSWEPEVATRIIEAIREACPTILINQSTGTVGPDIDGPLACLRAVRPEIAACNAGSLNYLKVKADGSWAWPPMLFDNSVDKVARYLAVMRETATLPEFECFDTGIVRCVAMYAKTRMFEGLPKYNFVMGVESGMPADPDLLPILTKLAMPSARWSVTAIGRAEIWPLHQCAAELGGDLRTGLEDSFYLPGGEKASSNGPMVEALVGVARAAGREIADPSEAHALMQLRTSPTTQ